MARVKIALFGGTFDPIHIGHTTVASAARRALEAAKLIFIPAKRSPLKGFSPRASDEQRLEMISIAISDQQGFEVSSFELEKPAPSYSIDTIQHFRCVYGPDSEICWLIGADGIKDLAYWYRVEELIDSYTLCTMYRAGFEKPDFRRFEKRWGKQRVEKLERNIIETPLVPVSSTEIRRRLAAGEDVSDMLHPGVLRYIQEHRIYCNP